MSEHMIFASMTINATKWAQDLGALDWKEFDTLLRSEESKTRLKCFADIKIRNVVEIKFTGQERFKSILIHHIDWYIANQKKWRS